LIALGVLSVDLQAYFLAHPFVEEIEIQPAAVNGYYQPQPAGYYAQPQQYVPVNEYR
ncbi:hypothetical protein BGZ49_004134, partial [Haplosporangium sp. Z 27]